MILRPALAGDAQALSVLHALAFDTSWSAHEIGSFLAGPGGFALAAEDEGRLAGFILCRVIAGEGEVLTLATDPARRRQGVGRALVEAAAGVAAASGAASLFLEVAADNAGAIELYHGAHFLPVGRRAGYYARASGGPVDALVLRRDLSS